MLHVSSLRYRAWWCGLPYALVLDGSVVVRRVFGLTHGQARQKATNWINRAENVK